MHVTEKIMFRLQFLLALKLYRSKRMWPNNLAGTFSSDDVFHQCLSPTLQASDSDKLLMCAFINIMSAPIEAAGS